MSLNIEKAIAMHYHNGVEPWRVFFEVTTDRCDMARGYRRIDAVAVKVSWSKPEVIAFEVKRSRSDFLQDSKWDDYLPYCHRLYFAAPAGLLKRSEIPDPAGLVEISDKGLRWSKKAIYRPTEIPARLYQRIIFSHLESEVCPFHKREHRAEHYADWLEGKKATLPIGSRMAYKLSGAVKKLEKLNAQIITANRLEAQLRDKLGIRYGYDVYDEILRKIDDLLAGTPLKKSCTNRQALVLVQRSLRDIERLLEENAA